MLLHLRIRDFAIIDAIEVDFEPGFTVVTGETGAGKSILVDALMVALGGRASADLIRNGAVSASVEALFDIRDNAAIQARLAERELVGDDPHVLLVQRSIAERSGARGRGKVVINGKLATVATLTEVVRSLVDISGQHEQQTLLLVESHLGMLDAFGGLEPQRQRYAECFGRLRGSLVERDRLQRSDRQNQQRVDFLRFQLDEIERCQPQVGELERLQADRARLAHAEKLGQGSAEAEVTLYSQDGSAFESISRAAGQISELARIDPELEPIARSLENAQWEIEDAARTLQRYADRIDADPDRLEEVSARIDELGRLCRKHGGSIEATLQVRDTLAAELDGLEHSDARLAILDQQFRVLQAETLAAAETLTRARQDAAGSFGKRIVAEVADMELSRAVVEVRVEPRQSGSETVDLGGGRAAGASGLDDVEFLWSANPGEPPKPLVKIASGGELSRLMLAVKRILARRDLVSLYVFDEVDTGLGGKAADSIGRKIQDVARDHQAIAITHLAPIAARAEHHFVVSKHTCGERTVSKLQEVRDADRAAEIARMIDGGELGEATRQAAQAMLARRAS